MEEVKELKRIMEEILEVEVNEQTASENTENWDSLAHMKLIIALEENFELTIEAQEILQLMSYQKIMEYLKGKEI